MYYKVSGGETDSHPITSLSTSIISLGESITGWTIKKVLSPLRKRLSSKKIVKGIPLRRSPRRPHPNNMPTVFIEQVEFNLIPCKPDCLALLFQVVSSFSLDELDVRLIHGSARIICKADEQHDYFSVEPLFQYPDLKQYYGPSTLANIVDFIQVVEELNKKKQPLKTPCLVIRTRSPQALNGIFLCAAYLFLHKKMGIHQIMADLNPILDELTVRHYKTEGEQRDDDLRITIETSLLGLQDFINLGLLLLDGIDGVNTEEIKFREDPANGDMNWVIPGRILALAGPTDNGYSIEEFADYAQAHNVGTVVRLNAPLYRITALHHRGISHHEMFMEDGSIPNLGQIHEFYKIATECWENGIAIAVHCMAGLGRTGTMIATFLIKRYGLRAERVIALLRIMRPGSILGMQARFLESIQYMLRGEATPNVDLAFLIIYPKEYFDFAARLNSQIATVLPSPVAETGTPSADSDALLEEDGFPVVQLDAINSNRPSRGSYTLKTR